MGSLDFGFNAAANVVPDLWDLAGCVQPAFEELVQAVRPSPAPPSVPGRLVNDRVDLL
jgi:hypothetical protein